MCSAVFHLYMLNVIKTVLGIGGHLASQTIPRRDNTQLVP